MIVLVGHFIWKYSRNFSLHACLLNTIVSSMQLGANTNSLVQVIVCMYRSVGISEWTRDSNLTWSLL